MTLRGIIIVVTMRPAVNMTDWSSTNPGGIVLYLARDERTSSTDRVVSHEGRMRDVFHHNIASQKPKTFKI